MPRVASAVLFALALALAAPAAAHDSDAPRDADHRWLPAEPWVQKHWLPFDESHLYEILRVDTQTVFRWLADDHRTLAQLAGRRGVSRRTLAKRLMEPRRASLSDNEYRVLRRRTERTLTQGHLAQHVFFHVFHGSEPHGRHDVVRLYGVGAREYRRLRQRMRLTPFQIARRNGRSTAAVRKHVIHTLESEAAAGVRAGAMTEAQGKRLLARQLRVVDCWLKRPAPKFDRANPFGDRYSGHGLHRRGSRVGIKHPKPPHGCWKRLIES